MQVIFGRSTMVFTCEDHKHIADVYCANLHKTLEEGKGHSVGINRIESSFATVIQADFREFQKP